MAESVESITHDAARDLLVSWEGDEVTAIVIAGITSFSARGPLQRCDYDWPSQIERPWKVEWATFWLRYDEDDQETQYSFAPQGAHVVSSNRASLPYDLLSFKWQSVNVQVNHRLPDGETIAATAPTQRTREGGGAATASFVTARNEAPETTPTADLTTPCGHDGTVNPSARRIEARAQNGSALPFSSQGWSPQRPSSGSSQEGARASSTTTLATQHTSTSVKGPAPGLKLQGSIAHPLACAPRKKVAVFGNFMRDLRGFPGGC